MTEETCDVDMIELTRPLWRLYGGMPASVTLIGKRDAHLDRRRIYAVDWGGRRIVVKANANAFTTPQRAADWRRVADAYNNLGIYCPRFIDNIRGELTATVCFENTEMLVVAEEYARYKTAESYDENGEQSHVKENYGADGNALWLPDMLAALGRVAAARLDCASHPTAYCLYERFSPDDPCDETEECARGFFELAQTLPAPLSERALKLRDIYDKNRAELAAVYGSLPASCFQGDLNASNVLLDGGGSFAGLIDFNLSGREVSLNYTLRAAINNVGDTALERDGRNLFYYDDAPDSVRYASLRKNLSYIAAEYDYSPLERRFMPLVYRVIYPLYWDSYHELRHVKDEGADKIGRFFDWIEREMTSGGCDLL